MRFKDIEDAYHLLSTALRAEQNKHLLCPVSGYPQEHANAQGWGYVVAGYSLLEQSLKLLLGLENKTPRHSHGLLDLFQELSSTSQGTLREYYDSYRHGYGDPKEEAWKDLEAFLKNLDGRKGNNNQDMGSIDWRYYISEKLPGENAQSIPLPAVSADLLHEIIRGAIDLCGEHLPDTKAKATNAYVYRRLRDAKGFLDNGVGGIWPEEDGLYLLCGPDHKDRYGFLLVKGAQRRVAFECLPGDLQPVDFRRDVSRRLEAHRLEMAKRP